MPERKISYEKFSAKRDVGVSVTAPSYQRLFIDAALALTDFRFAQDLIETKERKQIKVTGKDFEELLKNWLLAVFALSKEQKFLPRRIVIDKFAATSLEASLHGENHNPLKHGGLDSVSELVTENLKITTSPEGFSVRVACR